MQEGMDVVRINFSHGSSQEWLGRVLLIKALNKKYRRHIRILGDLEGFRIRLGRFPNNQEIQLKKGQDLILTNREIPLQSFPSVIPLDYPGSLGIIKNNSFIYIDDGTIALRVRKTSSNFIQAEVVSPGVLKERKGVNIPDVSLDFLALSEKDKSDILFAIQNNFDYLAQSFVRGPQDIISIRKLIKRYSWKGELIAKIENEMGFKNLDRILDVSDGIMVARGDLGVSLPIYKLPIIQKLIIRQCLRRLRFVITATQMLESMTENNRPTRAEVTDVANAILDGTDFVMLSAETAVGRFPVECVRMMNQIIKYTEKAQRDKII